MARDGGVEARAVAKAPRKAAVQWSQAKQAKFLAVLADTGRIDLAADAVNVTKNAIHRLRRADAEFDEQWSLAIRFGYERIEAALIAQVLGEETDLPGSKQLDFDRALTVLGQYHKRASGQSRIGRPRRLLNRKELTGAILARLALLERREKVPPECSALPAPLPDNDTGKPA